MIKLARREQVQVQAHEWEEKRPNAEADGGGPAGALVFHFGALKWIPLKPLRRLTHAALEGYSMRSEMCPANG